MTNVKKQKGKSLYLKNIPNDVYAEIIKAQCNHKANYALGQFSQESTVYMMIRKLTRLSK